MGYVLDETKTLEIRGITFMVKRTWDGGKWAVKTLKQGRITQGDEDEDDRAAEAIEKVLLRLVAGWTGVIDTKGKPVAWGKAALGLLDPEIINDLLGHILGTSPEAQGKAGTSSEPETPLGEATS